LASFFFSSLISLASGDGVSLRRPRGIALVARMSAFDIAEASRDGPASVDPKK
jgi:hypothetical protein